MNIIKLLIGDTNQHME